METLGPLMFPTKSIGEDAVMQDPPAAEAAAPLPSPSPMISTDAETRCAPEATPRRPYTPQFSSASWILSRIKGERASTGSDLPPTAETASQAKQEGETDTGETRDASMIDTMPMPVSPTHQLFDSVADMLAVHSRLTGLKRKREQDGETDDFTQPTMPLPMPAPAPVAAPSAPKTLGSVPQYSHLRCSKCDQDSSESLFSCGNCSKQWHQGCLPLATKEEEEQQQQPVQLMCPSCSSILEKHVMGHHTKSSRPMTEIERRRAKNLAALPAGVVPAKAEHVGFWAGQASDAAMTEYFYGKTKTDVLNILSFCDQLKPQLLVDIMVSVAKKHPDLPIFDSPNWNAATMSAISVRTKSSVRSAARPRHGRHGHTVSESRTKHKQRVSKKTIKLTSIPQTEELPLVGYRESLPPMWPKAGEGMYALLSPEDEDRAFLLDENDEEAFSHFGVDKFGKQIAIPASA